MTKLNDTVHEHNYVYSLHFHFAWATKYRRTTFMTLALMKELEEILNYIAELNNITIKKMKVTSDHVHTLSSFKQKKIRSC